MLFNPYVLCVLILFFCMDPESENKSLSIYLIQELQSFIIPCSSKGTCYAKRLIPGSSMCYFISRENVKSGSPTVFL